MRLKVRYSTPHISHTNFRSLCNFNTLVIRILFDSWNKNQANGTSKEIVEVTKKMKEIITPKLGDGFKKCIDHGKTMEKEHFIMTNFL